MKSWQSALLDDRMRTLHIQNYEVMDWLKEEKQYSSPQGHLWAKRAHWIIGHNLVRILRELLS